MRQVSQMAIAQHGSVRARPLIVMLVLIITALLAAHRALADESNDEKSEGEQAKSVCKPAAPRTAWQAIHAYCNRLRYGPPLPEKKSEEPNEKDKSAEKDSKEANGKKAESEKAPMPRSSDDKVESKKPEGPEQPKNKDEKEDQDKDKNKDKEKEKDSEKKPEPAWYSGHAQATMESEIHGPFHSPYVGPHSLSPFQEIDTSLTATVFLDFRLWECGNYSGELVFDPELAGGKGFSGIQGLAGFPNGDISRVGVVEPTPYIARMFLRQTWGFGGEQEKVEDAANQIAGTRDVNRFTLSAGKWAFTDFIDANQYSHDPRTQMQNWSLMYNGAWDYPANVRGYDYGVLAELNEKWWALRYGIVAEPEVANGAAFDPHINKALGQAIELEERWCVCEFPGRVRLMTYLNHAHMGDYHEALLEMPVDPDVTLTRAYRFKYGFGLNFEQTLTADLGLWGRLGWNDGHTETWAFTPIDRTAAIGLLLKGTSWARPNDTVGLAGALNGISKDHRQYLAAGGLDFSIGDGRLNYGLEEIFEIYYRIAITKGIYVIADFQEIGNPAYNRDRGPVSVESALVHIEF